MANFHRFHIERQGDGPDYYPLTTQEVIELLSTAIALNDHASSHPQEATQGIASIQIRLGQGIPGMTVPYELDGPVAEKHNTLDETYVNWIQDPMTLFLKEQPLTEDSEIVVKLMELMR